MSKIFVSYSHKDGNFVSKLTSGLERDHEVSIDGVIIVPDIPLIEQISAYIDTCNYFLPVISRNSVESVWVKREIALAYDKSLARESLLIPVIVGRTKVPRYLAAIHYIRFHMPNRPPSFNKCLGNLLELIRRSPIISGNLVLGQFVIWGKISVRHEGEFGLRVKSQGVPTGASGLCFDKPLYLTGFSKVILTISGSTASDFTGWSRVSPKMLKLEIDGIPVPTRQAILRARDDEDYIKPTDGSIEFELPLVNREKGFARKLEIVFGKGRINGLILYAKLA